MHAPEQDRHEIDPVDISAARNIENSFSDTPVQVQVAVTPQQHRLVRVARMLADRPTARVLAIAADIDFPTTCAELKILARLGVVEWGETVRVVREPDGLFFVPRCDNGLRDAEPEAVSFCAPEQGATS